MSEVPRELVELRKEIVEARNQAIKTDNQVRNLALDVKGFEQRFETLEKRTRMASVGVHGIVALTIALAAYATIMVREQNHKSMLSELRQEVAQAQVDNEARKQRLETRLAAVAEEEKTRARAARSALRLVEFLDANKEKEAADLLPNIALAKLSPLERRMLGKRLVELRKKAGESAYRSGRNNLNGGRIDAAIKEFARSVAIDPKGRLSAQARYLLGTNLYSEKRYQEAEPVLREIQKLEDDKLVQDEVRYLLGNTLAKLGKTEEARALLTQAAGGGRYQAASKARLAALNAEASKATPEEDEKKSKPTGNRPQASAPDVAP